MDKGYVTYTCLDCGASYTDGRVESTRHTYIPTLIKPTCTSGGYVLYECDGCFRDYKALRTTPLAHSYDDAKDAVCNDCGEEREVVREVPTITGPVDTDEGLSTLTIVLIIVGCVVVVAAVAFLIYRLIKKRNEY
jgi:DNA-directed RNA polymerase subunit RPC12/RpoP